MALTAKQELFVQEYLVDLNATQAAIRVGYSPKTAYSQASRMLRNVKVSEAVAEANKKRLDETKIDAAYVLRQAVKVHERCLQEEPVMIREGDKWVESGEYKFDSAGANKALDMVGKHVSVLAFNNSVNMKHTGKDGGPIEHDLKPNHALRSVLDSLKSNEDD